MGCSCEGNKENCRCGKANLDIKPVVLKVKLSEITEVTAGCYSIKEIPATLDEVAKLHQIDLSSCKILVYIDGNELGNVGVVFHYDLETLNDDLSDYTFIVAGKNIFKRLL